MSDIDIINAIKEALPDLHGDPDDILNQVRSILEWREFIIKEK